MNTWQPDHQTSMIMALEGFLSAGETASIIYDFLDDREHEVLYSFDLDDFLDYRSRRPAIGFNHDHFHSLQLRELAICGTWDDEGKPFVYLTGPEPDLAWERFSREVMDFMIENRIDLLLNLSAVPMAVPHTRPIILTSHGTMPELVDRENVFKAELYVPSSAQTFTEYRAGLEGLSAAGYVAHVPHYVAQMPYPTAAVTLLDAAFSRLDLTVDFSDLKDDALQTLSDLTTQVEDSDNENMVAEMESHYDDLTKLDPNSLLNAGPIPSADDLAREFERFLASRDKRKDSE